MVDVPLENLSDGTAASGFVGGKENKPPRQCGNCIWMGLGSCGHPAVVSDPELKPRERDGRVPVDDDDCCNSMQSMGNAIIYAVRHGDTIFNQENAFRGWMNVELAPDGKKQAIEAGEFLVGKGIKEIYSSDLKRAVQTAKLITNKIGAVTVTHDEMLRPWDVGIYTAKGKDEHQESFNRYIDEPDVEIPGGESLKQFATRQSIAFRKYIKIAEESGPILLVFHSSNCIQLDRQIEHGEANLGRPEDAEILQPGGIMCVLDQNDNYRAEVIFKRSGEQDANK